jgi:hypothetical protein
MVDHRYELVSVVVTNHLRCRYGVNVHSAVVFEKDIFDRPQVEPLARGLRSRQLGREPAVVRRRAPGAIGCGLLQRPPFGRR